MLNLRVGSRPEERLRMDPFGLFHQAFSLAFSSFTASLFSVEVPQSLLQAPPSGLSQSAGLALPNQPIACLPLIGSKASSSSTPTNSPSPPFFEQTSTAGIPDQSSVSSHTRSLEHSRHRSLFTPHNASLAPRRVAQTPLPILAG